MADIPIGRIIDKLDEYLNKNAFAPAQRHLEYWLSEAEHEKDDRGKLTVLNEQIGLYRKMGDKEKGLAAIEAVLDLCEKDGSIFDGTISLGTTFVNAATGCKEFGQTDRAMELYRKAKTIYDDSLPSDDDKFAALYNNMAITLTELGDYDEAEQSYGKALDIVSGKKNGELEAAITYLNLADLVCAKVGMEEGETQIEDYLDLAENILDENAERTDHYYAFVCEKCAPAFGYYGYFMTEKTLKKRAKEIYERS